MPLGRIPATPMCLLAWTSPFPMIGTLFPIGVLITPRMPRFVFVFLLPLFGLILLYIVAPSAERRDVPGRQPWGDLGRCPAQ